MGQRADSGSSRIGLAQAGDFDLGAARVRPSLLEIRCGGSTRVVEPRVMQALVALHGAGGTPISRDDLIERCWAGLAISDDAVTQCISKLRRAMQHVPGARVEAIPRVGYRLAVESVAGESGRRQHQPATWAKRAAGGLLLIAGVSALGFDSTSVATTGQWETDGLGTNLAGSRSPQADRLHAAAVRVFRERTRAGYAEAEALLRRAVALDPRHAPSWARLAMAVYAPHWWQEKSDPEARARLRSEAIGYVRRSLSLDPNLAEAHQAMGFILGHDGGVKWLEQAAALDPDNPEISVTLAGLLENNLELRRANSELLHAMQLEPTSQQTVFAASSMLDRLGDRSKADAIVDNFERVTQRSSDARRYRFELAFGRGELAAAAALASRSLDMGDEDQWWRQWRLFDVATGLNDRELRARMLHLQPRLGAIDYADGGYALKLARTRPGDWWASPVVGGFARQLVMSGNDRVLLALYDDRYRSTGDMWKEHGDWADCLAPPLAIAMRRAGRPDEGRELRDHFAADINKLAREGDATIGLAVWRAQLAALDGDAGLAARWLDTAVSAGWKGQAAYRVGFDPDRDPVMALVRRDARVQRAIAHFHASAAAEAAALRKLDLIDRHWAAAANMRSPA